MQNYIWTTKSAPYPLAFALLTSKCASRHNGVRFFNISTSTSALNVVCFVHFDLGMCFAPQWRALFQHLNFQKCSEPAALASLLFDPPEPQIIGQTPCFATFLPFRAPGSSFFWDFLFLVFFLLLFSSLTLPISAFHLSILSEVWLLNFLRPRECPPLRGIFAACLWLWCFSATVQHGPKVAGENLGLALAFPLHVNHTYSDHYFVVNWKHDMTLQSLQDNICKCLINAVENYASGYLQNKSNIYLHHSILFLCSRDSPITNSQEVFASWDASWIPGCSKIQPALYPLQHGCMLALHLGCLWRSGFWSIPVTSDHHPIETSRVDCHPACFPHFLECHRGWDPVQTQQMHQSRKRWHRPASIEESSMTVMAVPTHLGTLPYLVPLSLCIFFDSTE